MVSQTMIKALNSVQAQLVKIPGLTDEQVEQIIAMFAAAGNHVETLHRESVGGLALPADLAPGAIRRLGEADLAAIFEAGGG